jgi:cytochrome c biogenesis protein CcmG, thiol:disulfide interchange protein DsbE
MNKRTIRNIKTLIPLVIFLVISSILWFGLHRSPHKIPSPFIGKHVPGFSANSLLEPQQKITDADLHGQVSLLNIFATWCMSCRVEHPLLMNIQESYHIKLYGLDYKDQRKAALAWLKKFGDPYNKIIFDPRGELGINLGVYGTPETLVIDKSGVIRYKYIGPITPDVWQRKLLPIIQKLQRA